MAEVVAPAITNGNGKGSMLRIPIIFVVGLVVSGFSYMMLEIKDVKAENADMRVENAVRDERDRRVDEGMIRMQKQLDTITPIILRMDRRTGRTGNNGRD